MRLICPRCESTSVVTRNYGKKVCSTLGAIAGAAAATTAALHPFGSLLQRDVPSFGNAGEAVASITAATLAALAGGASGAAAGVHLGEVIDQDLLHNAKCLSCGHRFTPEPIGFGQ